MARSLPRSRLLQWPEGFAALLVAGALLIAPQPLRAGVDDASPPAQTVKLIFIHHSCGENWLPTVMEVWAKPWPETTTS